MPYVTCERCAARAPVARDSADAVCARCGQPLHEAGRVDPEQVIAGSLRLLRDLLGMDVAMLTEIHRGRETARHVAGRWPGLGDLRAASLPLEDTFCQRLLEGRIDNLVADVVADERVRGLAMARDLGVGAWMGVPARASDARLYVLCCLARESRPDLGPADVAVLRGFVRSVVDQMGASRAPTA